MTRTDGEKWVRAAVVQAGAVLFESDACVDKAVRLIQEAAATGAKVIVFPEAFIGGYPKGLNYDLVVGVRSLRAGRVPAVSRRRHGCVRSADVPTWRSRSCTRELRRRAV
jgi:hypothetical protein